jgi:hypothetical protein
MQERESLEAFLNAIDAAPRALRRDGCDDWHITGKHGHIYVDGGGYLIVITTDESARRWGNIKRNLPLCKVTQDGDDGGALRLDRLPSPHEAEIIRNATGIRKRRYVTPEAKATLASRLSKKPYKTASGNPGLI